MRFTDLVVAGLGLVEAQYVNIPLARQTSDVSLVNKRQISNGTLSLNSQSSGYVANISFGSPQQTVQLILDTGSPLTWVNAQNVSTFVPGSAPTSAQQSAGARICTLFSCLNPSTSSSLTVPSNSTVFNIQYVDGTESIGRIVRDTMTFQGLTDSTFDFGLVEYFYSPSGVAAALGGILGLSPQNPVLNYDNLTEALTSTSTSSYFQPQTIIQQLRNAGAISSEAFSLFLSDGNDGQLTIGGLDTSRYSGPLTVVPIVDDPSTVGKSFYVTLNSIGAGGSNTVSVNSLFVLDSGTTSTYVPSTVLQQLASNIGGYIIPYSSSESILGIPCTQSTTIDFYFANNGVVKVPSGEVLEGRLTASQARRVGVSTSSDICVLSIFGTSSSDSYLLGDSFLRSAYVVYDLAQNEIAIGQSAYGGQSNVLSINSGAFGIPGAVYNTSSPGASNVAVVPSGTRVVTLASGAGVRTSVLGGTLTQTATSQTNAASGGMPMVAGNIDRAFVLVLSTICVVTGILIT